VLVFLTLNARVCGHRLVRLPTPKPEGMSFEFGTPYEKMLQALMADAQNLEFYRKSRLLDIVKRNVQTKTAPERWQDTDRDVIAEHDVVVCFEQRIFDAVIEGADPWGALLCDSILLTCVSACSRLRSLL
jgi:hypothetical protein